MDRRQSPGANPEVSAALVPELDVVDVEDSVAFYAHYGFGVLYARPSERFVYLRRGAVDLMLQDAIGPGRRWRTAQLQRPHGRGINLQIDVGNVDLLWTTRRSPDTP